MTKTIQALMLAASLAWGLVPSLQASDSNSTTSFEYTGSIATWTVPLTASYEITAYGAKGGGAYGGNGAVIGGSFLLDSGVTLNLLVGGQGATAHGGDVSGGGGGTFVVAPTNTPLLVAGGGGGSGYDIDTLGVGTNSHGYDASTTTSGTGAGSSGGTNGAGGLGGGSRNNRGGGGGGGLFGSGMSGNEAAGGQSYLSGGSGGGSGGSGAGGFGGGGQANDGGGGGGGYSGGGGGEYELVGRYYAYGAGGGGGSFIAVSASNVTMSVPSTAARADGLVTISYAGPDLAVGIFGTAQMTVVTQGTSNYENVFVGVGAGYDDNSLTVANASTTLAASGNVVVGVSESGNSLVVSNGATVVASGTDGDPASGGLIGYNAGASNNSITVTGAGSTLSSPMGVTVGLNGSGSSLVISNGGTASSNIGQIGYAAASSNNSVLVMGIGSAWNNLSASNGIQVGVSGQGVLTVADEAEVRLNSASPGLTLAQNAGSSGTLNIGRYGAQDAAGTISTPRIVFGDGTGTINFNQSTGTDISAPISGNGSVNQLGSGMTILSGNNTYTGTTTVVNGTLLVDGEVGLSDVSVSSGAAFGGSGVLGGNLTLEAGAQFVFSLSDALTVNGSSVSFGRFGIDDLVGLDSTVPNGAYTLIDGTATIDVANLLHVGEASAFDLGGGKEAYFSIGSLVVNVVPEPSTYALLGLAAVALGGHVLRQRRSA
jgi:T5SS/PEP-CTERM-associated repeat protein